MISILYPFNGYLSLMSFKLKKSNYESLCRMKLYDESVDIVVDQ